MKAVFQAYRLALSPFFQLVFGIQCRYEESCSRYTERMISQQGLFRGLRTGLARFLKCNSFGAKDGR